MAKLLTEEQWKRIADLSNEISWTMEKLSFLENENITIKFSTYVYSRGGDLFAIRSMDDDDKQYFKNKFDKQISEMEREIAEIRGENG